MSAVVDLNCDMGESYGCHKLGYDEDVIKYITSANIACGFHAGDPAVIRATVVLAGENGVGIGAHPSLPDMQGFGRLIRRGLQAEGVSIKPLANFIQ